MSGFDRSDRDRVLEATDLVALVGEHVRLTRKGREHLGLCPFHDDHRPSMAVVSHKGIPFFKCFSCGAAGNAIDFFMRYHRLEFPEALRQLAERAGVALTPRRGIPAGERDVRSLLLRANEMAAKSFRRFLADPELGGEARAMLNRRGVAETARESFGLGAAPAAWDRFATAVTSWVARQGRDEADRLSADDFAAAGLLRRSSRGEWIDGFRNRLIFPIRSEMGRVVAFGGRQLDPEDQPKYLNSPESPVFDKSATLFGLDLAKQSIIKGREAVVVEGYLDVIACHAAGFDQVVATLGTALTPAHARLLRHKADRVVLLFDGDEAGQRAADRAVEVFLGGTLDVRIGVLPGGLDPDDLLKQDGGREVLQGAIDSASDALDFLLRRFGGAFAQADGLSARQTSIEAFLRRLAELGFDRMAPLRRSLVLDRLAQLTGLTAAALSAAVPTLRRAAVPAAAAAPESAQPRPMEPMSPALRVAERSLASVFLSWPALAATESEALARGWRDPAAHAVAIWIREAVDADREPALADLLTAVDARDRHALDELIEHAERRPSLEGDARSQLDSALADLERLDRLEAHAEASRDEHPPRDPHDVLRRLERLRDGGVRAAAIGRVPRTA